jgi:hypothetical protein
MAVSWAGMYRFKENNGQVHQENNYFKNKHLFVVDDGVAFDEMVKKCEAILKARQSGKEPKKFGGCKPPANTLVVTNSIGLTQMEAALESEAKKAGGTKCDVWIPIYNGVVVQSANHVKSPAEGTAKIQVSVKKSGSTYNVHHYKNWSKANASEVEDKEFLIPFWMALNA